MQKKWKNISDNHQIDELVKRLKLPKYLINILFDRGYTTETTIKSFLYDGKAELSSPLALINIAAATERIKLAIDKGEKITIYGDYDVDGFCSATLLKRALNYFYDNVDIYIPNRLEEGYGLNESALELLMEEGTQLIITVDCGVSSTVLVNQFIKKGLSFIITDHHQLPEVLPNTIVVNPLLERDMDAPYRNLSGCGVAFMLALALGDKLQCNREIKEKLFSLIDIAAIATIADVMSLTQDNRIIVKEGLNLIRKNPRPFIQSIFELIDLPSELIDTEVIGYQIAPRINACGRLNQIDLGISFLLEDDIALSKEILKNVDALNQERKQIAESIWQDALLQIDNESYMKESAIVVKGDYHQGVIGIVASRLAGKFGVPAVVLAKTDDGYVGSARSIKGIHLYQVFSELSEHLQRYGGHAMAAGLGLKEEAFVNFKAEFIQLVKNYKTKVLEEPLEVSLVLEPSQVDERLYQTLALLEPTGQHNSKPVLALIGRKDYHLKTCGANGEHLQFQIDDFRGIAFGGSKYLTYYTGDVRFDLAFILKKNYFRGKERLEFLVEDFRPSYCSNDDLDDVLFNEGEKYLNENTFSKLLDQGQIFTKIVGVSFYNRQTLISNLTDDATLLLIREPDNPVDINAIQVVHSSGVLGYLKRELAEILAPRLDKGEEYAIVNYQKTGDGKETYGINLEISRCSCEAIASSELKQYSNDDIKNILLPNSPYNEKQKEALALLREGKRVLAIMPTGRGKSLIYQTRALELVKLGKMTVVISPLRSLISDQYEKLTEALRDYAVSVTKVTGEMTKAEKMLFEECYKDNKYHIIFTTPEYFMSKEALFLSNDNFKFLVLDEAHHLASRRIGYKYLKNQLSHFNCDVLALTATAEQKTFNVIMDSLNSEYYIVDEWKKENIQIVDARRSEQKIKYLKQLAERDEKTLVYVNSKKIAFKLSAVLREFISFDKREKIAYYHGGLPRHTRSLIEERFKSGDYKFLIATSAFGEGIDIPDIAHVVFFHLPFSKEMFNQLAGRAGRNGREAYVHLLYGKRDIGLNKKILDLFSPNREMLVKLYLLIKSESGGKVIDYTNEYLLKRLGDKSGFFSKKQVRLGLELFEELGLVELFKEGHQKKMKVVPQEKKLNLMASSIYSEGEMERENFLETVSLAFQKDIFIIEDTVNRALWPERKEDING